MSQQFVSLEIDSTIDGTDYTGRFEMLPAAEGSFSWTQEGRTGYLIEGAFGQISSIVTDLLTDEDTDRRSINIDLGGGQHAITVDFSTPVDQTKANGDLYQWGSSADPSDGPNRHTATGADPLTQLQVFMEYWRTAAPDSLAPARLSYGEYAPSGVLDDSLNVALEQPTVTRDNTTPSTADGSVTCIELRDIDQVIDAAARNQRGT